MQRGFALEELFISPKAHISNGGILAEELKPPKIKEQWLFRVTVRPALITDTQYKGMEFFTCQMMLQQGAVFFQQGNAFQSLREADVVAREEVTELIQLQAERISALKEEIALLRRKGGLILPPIRSPQEKEMQPADL